jgi:hypothetical protein
MSGIDLLTLMAYLRGKADALAMIEMKLKQLADPEPGLTAAVNLVSLPAPKHHRPCRIRHGGKKVSLC